MDIELFSMERYQSLYWHQVEYDLSESGVLPMSIRELLGPDADPEAFLATKLGYPLSEGSIETRTNIAEWYAGATPENVTVVNGGSEANFLTLLALLEPGDRLAFMVPELPAGRWCRSRASAAAPTRSASSCRTADGRSTSTNSSARSASRPR